MTALLRICGLEWLSIVTTSRERSRARSGEMVWESPFRLMAMSLGLEVRSCLSLRHKRLQQKEYRTHLLQEIRREHQNISVGPK